MKSKITPPLLLTIVAIGIIALLQDRQFSDSEPDLKLKIENKDSSWQFHNSTEWRSEKNKQNQTEYIYLKADRIQHFEDSNTTKLKQAYIIRQTDKNIVTLKANYAETQEFDSEIEANKKATRVELAGDVDMKEHDLAAPHNLKIQIEGQQLFYNSDTAEVHSKSFVKVSQEELVISGTGLDANIEKEDFTFHKNVKTLYSPSQDSDSEKE